MSQGNGPSEVPKRHVAIVGGGLVGALAALYFAQRDWNVNLFESRKDPRLSENKDSISQRSINLALSTRGISALSKAGLGLDRSVLGVTTPMKGRMIHVGKGKLKSQSYGNTYENIYSVEREVLLELLLNAAEIFRNVKFFFQHTLKRCDLDVGLLEFE
ncbi:197_t:CDS:2 [Acaulospora colombiana]|uniref:197_t:CDS:1 n=1 Tax=Acaulospora colombiana TaxID=27376 RepID=A0ACA9MK63_9GLOM|nr:197_t:CDS:2 [Acaulospora colombiana]